jgi:TonB family protein
MDQHSQRRKRNSSKVNLTISMIFHGTLLLGVAYFAAREGVFGKRFQQITVSMVKEKKPEAPKEKPQQPKIEPPKPVAPPKPAAEVPRAVAVAPPPSDAAPAVAPPPVSLPSFEFNDGAHDVVTASDPKAIYKGLLEHSLRSRWNRPEVEHDDQFAADVELTVDAEGNITDYKWISGSGDARWDNSVKQVLTEVKSIGRPPPKGFPSSFVVRFDVEPAGQDGIQLSAR